jgi:La-related protein 7
MEGGEGAQTSLPEVETMPSSSDHHLDSSSLPPSTLPLSEELADLQGKIVRQVEFYFSDANLPTDDFLLKILHRPGNEGWVPIKTLASFAKMKKLTRDIPTIVDALISCSTELEVSPEGQRVKRKQPFNLNVDVNDIRSRTVITWNLLPEKPTIKYVIDLFSTVGEVDMARIRKADHPEPLLTRGLKIDVAKSARDFYALIEFKTRDDAVRSVHQLHDESNWRSGLRVKLLIPQPEKVFNGVDVDGKKKSGDAESIVAGNKGNTQLIEGKTFSKEEEKIKERPKPAWARGGKKENNNASKKLDGDTISGSGGSESDVAATTNSTASNAVGKQPRMPDVGNNRGFGLGRGTLLLTDRLFKLLSLVGEINHTAAPGSNVDDE